MPVIKSGVFHHVHEIARAARILPLPHEEMASFGSWRNWQPGTEHPGKVHPRIGPRGPRARSRLSTPIFASPSPSRPLTFHAAFPKLFPASFATDAPGSPLSLKSTGAPPSSPNALTQIKAHVQLTRFIKG
jgi:hypothetical protein